MIKNIKDGLSHARKDRIKILYEIEFKKLTNLSDDLIDQFISIKWERGKSEKGETKEVRVVNGKIEQLHNSSNLTHSISLSEIPFNSTTHTHRIGYNTINGNGSSSKSVNNRNSVGPSIGASITSSATPYIELEKIPKTLTRKQSKLLLGNKIDSSNMSGGDAIAIIPNERTNFKVTLFSNTIHSKDHSLQTNYEQKLLNLYIYNKNNLLGNSQVDLSLHTDECISTTIAIPFASSTLAQPTLFMNIKTTYLKYNDKPIIKASKEILSKKEELKNILQANDANPLLEYQGEVYFILRNKSNLIGSIKEESNGGKETVNKVLRFEIEENMDNNNKNNENNNENNDSDNSTNNNNYNNEKSSSQSTTWDEITEEDHFKNNVSEQQHNKIVCQKNEEIKELNEKVKKLQDDVSDQKRLRDSLQTLVDDCKVKVLSYEEHFHRAQSLENYAKKQLIIERLEFQKKIEKLSNQIKTLQQQQQLNNPLSNSITHILANNGSDVIKETILGTHKDENHTVNHHDQLASPDSGNSKNNREKQEKYEELLLELEEKKKKIQELTIKTDTNQLALEQERKKIYSENDIIKKQLDSSNLKVQELRMTIEKITKEQVEVDLKKEKELRKRVKSSSIIGQGGSIDQIGSGNKITFVDRLLGLKVVRTINSIPPLLMWSITIFISLLYIAKLVEC